MSDAMLILSSVLDLQPTSDPTELRCLCPLHAETHPSCYINTEKQVFYCFGCGQGGTLQRLLKLLKLDQRMDAVADQTVGEVLQQAQLFFRQQLFVNRQLVEEALGSRSVFIDRFGLGYAPPDTTALRKALSQFSPDLLIRSGLFSQSLYPVLSNRITIPIRDKNGKILGFAGRSIRDAQPKYINTRNLPRRALLFGADFALELLRPTTPLWVVEGYFDAMHLLYNGIPAVAICGTALTYAQAMAIVGLVMSKIRTGTVATVRICMDADEAGLRAAVNAALMLQTLSKIEPRIVFLPPGKDIDEIPIHQLRYLPVLRPGSALAQAIARLRLSPKEVARWLAEVDADTRRGAWRVLSETYGRAFLEAVNEEFLRLRRVQQRREIRRTNTPFGLVELALSAAIHKLFDFSQLPVDIAEVLPEPLRNIYEVVTERRELESLSEDEQRLYARLAIEKPIVSPTAIKLALEKFYWKQILLRTLDLAKTTTDLQELANIYRHAFEKLQSLRDAPDEVVDVADFLGL